MAPSSRLAASSAKPNATLRDERDFDPVGQLRAPTSRPPMIGSRRRPVPNASAPSDVPKYCGITNSRPNMQNVAIVARMPPQVNARERKSAGSISFWKRAKKRQQREHAGKRGDQPALSTALDHPVGERDEPGARGEQMPSTSRRGGCGSRDSGSRTAIAISPTATTGRLIRKTAPQA